MSLNRIIEPEPHDIELPAIEIKVNSHNVLNGDGTQTVYTGRMEPHYAFLYKLTGLVVLTKEIHPLREPTKKEKILSKLLPGYTRITKVWSLQAFDTYFTKVSEIESDHYRSNLIHKATLIGTSLPDALLDKVFGRMEKEYVDTLRERYILTRG